MCWTDKTATENIVRLRDEFGIKTAIATGCYRGADAELYGHQFKQVLSMDIDAEAVEISRGRLKYLPNVFVIQMSSSGFLKAFVKVYKLQGDTKFFWLDAHFYKKETPPDKRWVVVDELKALKGFKNCVIVIHDFDCEGLGHLIYDGEHLGWGIVGEYLREVNPDFHYYCNTKETCDIVTEETVYDLPIKVDDYILDGIRFTNSSDVKRYRGILYCVPKELDLSKYQLKRFCPNDNH